MLCSKHINFFCVPLQKHWEHDTESVHRVQLVNGIHHNHSRHCPHYTTFPHDHITSRCWYWYSGLFVEVACVGGRCAIYTEAAVAGSWYTMIGWAPWPLPVIEDCGGRCTIPPAYCRSGPSGPTEWPCGVCCWLLWIPGTYRGWWEGGGWTLAWLIGGGGSRALSLELGGGGGFVFWTRRTITIMIITTTKAATQARPTTSSSVLLPGDSAVLKNTMHY